MPQPMRLPRLMARRSPPAARARPSRPAAGRRRSPTCRARAARRGRCGARSRACRARTPRPASRCAPPATDARLVGGKSARVGTRRAPGTLSRRISDRRGHAGPHGGVRRHEIELDVEQARRRPDRAELDLGQGAERRDPRRSGLAADGLDLDVGVEAGLELSRGPSRPPWRGRRATRPPASCAIPAPAQARSPARHSRCANGPPARQFSAERDDAVGRRLQRQRRQPRLLEAHVGERLLAAPLERAHRRLRRRLVGGHLHRRFACALFGGAERDGRLLGVEPGDHLAGRDVELRALDVVAAPGLVAARRLGADRVVGARALDLRLGFAQRRALLGELAFGGRGVEADDDVAGLHRGAARRQEDDLQIAGTARRGDRHRAAGADLAADRQHVDEIAADDLGGLDARVGEPPPGRARTSHARAQRPPTAAPSAQTRIRAGRFAGLPSGTGALLRQQVDGGRQIGREISACCASMSKIAVNVRTFGENAPRAAIGDTCSRRPG